MNLLKSRTARIVGAGAVVGVTALAGPMASPALAASVPSCVSVTTTGTATHTIRIRNGCTTTQRVKIVLSNQTESACLSLTPGSIWTVTVAGTVTVKSVATC